MSVNLTPRMRSWIEHLGLHIALADGRAVPTVIVADKCFVSGHTIRVPLSRAQTVQAKAVCMRTGTLPLPRASSAQCARRISLRGSDAWKERI